MEAPEQDRGAITLLYTAWPDRIAHYTGITAIPLIPCVQELALWEDRVYIIITPDKAQESPLVFVVTLL